MQSAALTTHIDAPSGMLSILNLHLHDSSEDERLLELGLLFNQQETVAPDIVLGDFNAISRVDGYNPTTLECEARFDVTDALSKRYVEVFAAQASTTPAGTEFTHPTEINTDLRFTRPRRIDYCFASAGWAARLRRSLVIRGELAERTSDRYPILIEFEP